jgi:hypothetical protein
MKVLKIIIALVIAVLVSYFFDGGATGGVIMSMALIGGPLKDFKYASIPLHPTKDGEAEVEFSGINYERSQSPDGTGYTEGEARPGYVQQECVMTVKEYQTFKKKQDGGDYSGSATMPNGDILSINGSIDGEQLLTNGKVTVKIAGEVRVQ